MATFVSNILFAVFAAVVVFAALRVALGRKTMRTAISLACALSALAPLMFFAGAEFSGVMQIVVYVGAVVVLLIFGIMLTAPYETSEHPRRDEKSTTRFSYVAPAAGCVGLFIALAVAIVRSTKSAAIEPTSPIEVQAVADALMRNQIVAFEAMSVLLLGAAVGALVIGRHR